MSPVQQRSDVNEQSMTQFPGMGNVSYSDNPQNFSQQGIMMTQMTAEITTGPLPHPDLLIKYNKAIPNGAERIMKIAEKEQDNRIERQNKAVQANISTRKRGQVMAFILSLLVMGLFILLVFTGHSTEAYVIVGAGFLSVIGLFLEVLKKKN